MGQRRSLRDARLLITGASQGIGRCLAERAAARGARVLAAARSIERLRELQTTVRDRNQNLEIVRADVTQPHDRQLMKEAALQHFGGLDILINNAGVGAIGRFADCSPERLRSIMEVNFFGLTETIRVFLPLLKQGNRPAIVNVSSVIGKRAVPGMSEYCASKFAVQGFSESLRGELAKDGVDVLVVSPGRTQTNFGDNLIEQKSRRVFAGHTGGQSAQRVADATLRALERGTNEINLTAVGKLLVLVNRFMPRLVDWVFAREARKL
jgi:short-subunit dehydrogenase